MTTQSTISLKRVMPTQRLSALSLVTAIALSTILSPTPMCSAAESPGPWPQWRGPNGLGISNEPNLPVTWSEDSPNIRWKTKIPGRGVSSPVVSRHRVILTTAYESPGAAVLERIVRYTGLALLVVLVAIAAIGGICAYLRTARPDDPLPKWPHIFAMALATTLFVDMAILVTVARPSAQTLFVRIGHLFTRIGMPDMEHLWSMQEGVIAAIWLTSGSIALFGLAVVPMWLRRRSNWRFMAALAVLACILLLILLAPLDQWTEKTEWWERLIFTLPALILALWHLLGYLELRPTKPPAEDADDDSSSATNRHEPHEAEQDKWNPGPAWSVLTAAILLLLALLVFVPPNFIRPRLGLQRAVVCLDFNTGKILWTRSVFSAPAERIHSDNTYATPTPATDGDLILVKFGVGVAALDYNGNVIWKKPDFAYIPNSRYGAANSPLLVDDKAILLHQREARSRRSSWIIACDKRNANLLWRVNPRDIYGCYATPMLYESGGVTQLIIPSWQTLAGYDIDSGQHLWSIKLTTEQLVASPAGSGSLLCVAGSTWGRNATIMLKLNESDPAAPPGILWRSNLPVGNCSPVISNGLLFTLSDNARITCYNALTGDIHWETRLRGSRYLSSLLAAAGRIYASNTKGLTTVLAAEPQLKILSQNQLPGRLYASPATAHGCILLRVDDHLYCIEKSPR